MLTLTIWSITLKNVCIPKRIRSDLGVKLITLFEIMVVTLTSLEMDGYQNNFAHMLTLVRRNVVHNNLIDT